MSSYVELDYWKNIIIVVFVTGAEKHGCCRGKPGLFTFLVGSEKENELFIVIGGEVVQTGSCIEDRGGACYD